MKCDSITISDLKEMYKRKQINLDPPYQRKPAWRTRQRMLLLSSIFNGIPIPALIFYKHFDLKTKRDIYDVLDGKQRIETILHFIELRNIKEERKLKVEFTNPNTNKEDSWYYDDLQNKKINKDYEKIMEKFWTYKLPTIEYEGDLLDFFERNVASKEVFVRINSTGSPLKKHEIRHARYSGLFFELGDNLEKRYANLFMNEWKVVSKTDIMRYSFHEFILELCAAVHDKKYSDRRKNLDKLLSKYTWTKREVLKTRKIFTEVISWIKIIFTNNPIRFTRFKNKSDFYSLFVVLLSLINKGYVSNDNKSSKIVGKFLSVFSNQIKKLTEKIGPNLMIINPRRLTRFEQKLLPYLISTRQATDSLKNREIRHEYLMSVLKDGWILKMKDTKRIFSQNIKDLLWSELRQKPWKPKCPNPQKNKKCRIYLTYEDAQIDHKFPWSKGGTTKWENAALLCSSCNSAKGGKIIRL